MIFYFSGSGNSHFVASSIAEKLDIPLVSVAECLKKNCLDFDLRDSKYCGFVFPVYFWGLPFIINKFLKNISLNINKDTYFFVVFTCGGATGRADKKIIKLLNKKDIKLSSIFSVKQIDIFVPIFKIPEKNKIDEVIAKSQIEIENIINHIKNLNTGDFNQNKGFLPLTSTLLLYPTYFYYRKTVKFRVSASCITCKKCEKVCPLNVIEMVDNKPFWKIKQCTLCFSCLHICPVAAIDYGKVLFFFDSKNKGRYRNPNAPKRRL